MPQGNYDPRTGQWHADPQWRRYEPPPGRPGNPEVILGGLRALGVGEGGGSASGSPFDLSQARRAAGVRSMQPGDISLDQAAPEEPEISIPGAPPIPNNLLRMPFVGGALRTAAGLPELASRFGVTPGSPLGRAAQAPGQAVAGIAQAPSNLWRFLSTDPQAQPEPGMAPSPAASQAGDVRLPVPPAAPTQTIGGQKYPEGFGPSAVLGGAPVPFRMGETTPEDRAQLQATRQRMGTDQALEGMRGRQTPEYAGPSEYEMTRLAASNQGPTGAAQYWQKQLGEQVGERAAEQARRQQQYGALQGALTAQHPVVAGAAEQEARRASYPAVANVQAQLEAARAAATSREEVAEIQADERFLQDMASRLNGVDQAIARIAASAQGRTSEGQAQILEFQQLRSAYEQAIAAMGEDF